MNPKLITSDCHIALPYELTEELPKSYREYFPHVEQRSDGPYLVNPMRIGGAGSMLANGFSRPLQDDMVERYRFANTGVAESQASYDPRSLIADLERDSVAGAVLISRVAYRDDCPIEAQVAYCRLVNDYLADTYKQHLDRLAPGILLPFLDPSECAKELERAAGLGLRPALLPDAIWNQPYHDRSWEPLWEAAAGLDIPITMHVGSLRLPPGRAVAGMGSGSNATYPGFTIVGFYGQSVLMGETLGWLAFAGVFERHPNLHVVLTEGYAAWMGFAMQFFDHHFEQSRYLQTIPGLSRPDIPELPSHYLKRQAHATFMWDPLAVATREFTGVECLLWGNDYPHPEGSFPFSREWIDKQFAGVEEADVAAMVGGTASKLFRIEV